MLTCQPNYVHDNITNLPIRGTETHLCNAFFSIFRVTVFIPCGITVLWFWSLRIFTSVETYVEPVKSNIKTYGQTKF